MKKSVEIQNITNYILDSKLWYQKREKIEKDSRVS